VEDWKRSFAIATRRNQELLADARALTRWQIDRMLALAATRNDAGYAAALLSMMQLDHAAARRRPKAAAREAALVVRGNVPYRFEGDSHAIDALDVVLTRGWGACADGAAAVAGVFVGGHRRVQLCTETIPGVPQYAHARVMIDGVPVEPWPDKRRPEAHGCTTLDDVSDLLRALR
jgi:hypothetical protein